MITLTTTDDLAAFCQKARQHAYVTVDTEFLRERTYYSKLCLIQLAIPDKSSDSAVLVEAGIIASTVPRAGLRFSSTPQAYRRAALIAALDRDGAAGRDESTAFASMLRSGARVAAVEMTAANPKITWPEDLALLDGTPQP